MPRRDLRILLALCVLAVGLALAHSAVGLSTGFLFMAPALLLGLALTGGRYVGESTLARRHRPVPRTRHTLQCQSLPRRPLERLLPRGGRLLASALAVRPPPAAPATS